MTSEHEKVSKLFERAKNGVIVFLHSHARKLSKVLKKGFTDIKKILEGYFPSFAIFFKSPFLRFLPIVHDKDLHYKRGKGTRMPLKASPENTKTFDSLSEERMILFA